MLMILILFIIIMCTLSMFIDNLKEVLYLAFVDTLFIVLLFRVVDILLLNLFGV